MMWSSREKRRTTACSLFALLAAPGLLFGQQQVDSTWLPPTLTPVADRYTIDVEALTRTGAARTLSELLMGQVPGLLVIPGSGLNGGGSQVRFAGVRSLISDLPPLILLDGVRIDAHEGDSELTVGGPGPSRLDDIPIEDLRSIEVLEGPAATATYGPGAAAGVILIHSKAPRTGAIRVHGFAEGAVRAVPERWPANYGAVDLDNPDSLLRTGGCSLVVEAAGKCVQDRLQSFNPLVARNPFGAAPRRQLGLSAAGGPRWGAFRLSGNLDADAAAYDVPAVTWSDDYHRWNVGGGATLHPWRNVEIGANATQISSNLRLPIYEPVLAALMGPSDSSGFTWGQAFQSPGTQKLDRTLASVQVLATPLRWLAIQGTFGLDDIGQHERNLVSALLTTGDRVVRDRTYALKLTAANRISSDMRLTTVVGAERLQNREGDAFFQGSGGGYTSQQSSLQWRWFSVYGVEQLGIRDRFFVTGTLRHDALHEYSPGTQTNPSVAVDWILKTERPGALGRVAMRAAYGTASHAFPQNLQVVFVAPFQPVPAPLKPDRTREWQVAADAAGLSGRWRANVSFYNQRSQALQYFGVSLPSGGPSFVYAPGAVISNRGVTAALSANLIDRPGWSWTTQLSLWGNRNRVVRGNAAGIAASGIRYTGQREQAGYPAGGYWAWPITYADTNGDGIISGNEISYATNPASQVWAGTPYPTEGAALTSSWRVGQRWHVAATLEYRAGQTLFNQIANLRCLYAVCRDRYDPATPLSRQAMAVGAYAMPPQYFEDADYMKLRELVIVFDVPERLAAHFGARAASIMLGGRDLATWTSYSGADPETGSYGRSAGTPMMVGDLAAVPLPRSGTVRVRLSY